MSAVDVLAVWDRRIAQLQALVDEQVAHIAEGRSWWEPAGSSMNGAQEVLDRRNASLTEATEARAAVAELMEAAKAVEHNVSDRNVVRLTAALARCKGEAK